VHGEANEMSRLKAALIREYESDPTHNLEVHNPRNTVSSSWGNVQGQKSTTILRIRTTSRSQNCVTSQLED
jgi:hypothetical protein